MLSVSEQLARYLPSLFDQRTHKMDPKEMMINILTKVQGSILPLCACKVLNNL